MISRSLTRRLEDLESRIQPVGETRIVQVVFVDNDGKVVDQLPPMTLALQGDWRRRS